MKAVVQLLLFAMLAATAAGATWAVDSAAPIEDAEEAALYERLIHEVRCLVCQNQTIGDSTAPLAADLRDEIRRLVLEGKSEAEIEQFLLDRYGDFVLYRPRFQKNTALLWLAPFLLVLTGIVVLARILRRRAQMPIEDEPAAGIGEDATSKRPS